MKFIFFDISKEKITDYKNVLNPLKSKVDMNFICADLLNLITKIKDNIIIVSPANSYGDMTGGIDRDICKINDKIQYLVKKQIEKSKFIDLDNNKLIPVGHCDLVQINNKTSVMIAPTMKRPKDISNTENVFLAFKAMLLYLTNVQNLQNSVILCPCLGTGCGNMDSKKSAEQVLNAFKKMI